MSDHFEVLARAASFQKNPHWELLTELDMRTDIHRLAIQGALLIGSSWFLMTNAFAQVPGPSSHPSTATQGDALWGIPSPVEYRVLPRSTGGLHGEYQPVSPKPNILSKPTQPYAYGWFGAQPHSHKYLQFGTRRAYTQWTFK